MNLLEISKGSLINMSVNKNVASFSSSLSLKAYIKNSTLCIMGGLVLCQGSSRVQAHRMFVFISCFVLFRILDLFGNLSKVSIREFVQSPGFTAGECVIVMNAG